MSCKTFTEEIDEHKYTYTQLPAKKSLKLKYRLAGILGEALGDILPAVGKDNASQLKAFGSAVQDVFSRNDPDKIVKLVEDIFIPAFRDGERINMDDHFTGKMTEMYKVLFWVLKCEYGNFIDDINVA